jgi:phage-related protein
MAQSYVYALVMFSLPPLVSTANKPKAGVKLPKPIKLAAKKRFDTNVPKMVQLDDSSDPPELQNAQAVLEVRFFQTANKNEPVREWLKSLIKDDRKSIGEDIKTAQFGWPLGMPLIRKLEKNLWEVRTPITNGIARVLFTMVGNHMILLHGFVKKSQNTPKNELTTARNRLKLVE